MSCAMLFSWDIILLLVDPLYLKHIYYYVTMLKSLLQTYYAEIKNKIAGTASSITSYSMWHSFFFLFLTHTPIHGSHIISKKKTEQCTALHYTSWKLSSLYLLICTMDSPLESNLQCLPCSWTSRRSLALLLANDACKWSYLLRTSQQKSPELNVLHNLMPLLHYV
jgi:hypothetical protein